MDPGEFVIEHFTQSVNALVTSVREMIMASKLLRGRIESNDQVLLRFENALRTIADRIDDLDQRLTKTENSGGITYIQSVEQRIDDHERRLRNIGDFPSVIP